MDLNIMGSTYVISTPGESPGKPGGLYSSAGRVPGKHGEARGTDCPVRGESAESTGKPGGLPHTLGKPFRSIGLCHVGDL